jgi:hypothetical protein
MPTYLGVYIYILSKAMSIFTNEECQWALNCMSSLKKYVFISTIILLETQFWLHLHHCRLVDEDKTIGVMFTKKHMKSKTHSIMTLMITIILSKSLQHKMAMSCQSSVAADDG